MKKFFQEFKEFAMRGNVLDMAVGVVVGSAFTAIVTSIVQNLLTPLLGLLIPDSTFAEWAPLSILSSPLLSPPLWCSCW